jgi:hypothetical protein
VVQGKPDRLFALKHFIGCISMNDLDLLILNYLKERNIKYLWEFVEKMEEKLKVVKPDYIVLCMDMMPFERAIVLAAKNLGIPTLVIQHGIFSSSSILLDFKVADYILVWGKHFKDMCVKYCRRMAEDFFVLGYLFDLGQIKNNTIIKSKRLKVYYLGQDIERHNKDLLPIKMETIRELSRMCSDLGFDFVYRPHPRREPENMITNELAGVKVSSKKESLKTTFSKADILISFSSTALVEGAMRSKISLQLINIPLEEDNLEQLGACSKTFKTIEELRSYLVKISKAEKLEEFIPRFNEDYAKIRHNFGQRFLEIIETIEEKNAKK